ncbi:amidase family protein, partial [Escherichia coli]|uniref:amidase family protein n=1 Tax=Escherichia coli TaxID=562 RepID=UPI00207C140F
DLAMLVAARKISPVEVVDAILARVDRLEPKLNMFAELTADTARAAARAAETAVMAGTPLGPLHGVPITIKD